MFRSAQTELCSSYFEWRDSVFQLFDRGKQCSSATKLPLHDFMALFVVSNHHHHRHPLWAWSSECALGICLINHATSLIFSLKMDMQCWYISFHSGQCMTDLFPVIYKLQHGYFSFGHVKRSPLHPHQLSCFAYRNILLLTTFECQAQFTFAIEDTGIITTRWRALQV